MKGQLRLSRPASRKPTMRRLTGRQRELLVMMRSMGQIDTRTVRRLFGYSAPAAALGRLVDRGLARRVKRGVYAAVVLRERTIPYDVSDGPDEQTGRSTSERVRAGDDGEREATAV